MLANAWPSSPLTRRLCSSLPVRLFQEFFFFHGFFWKTFVHSMSFLCFVSPSILQAHKGSFKTIEPLFCNCLGRKGKLQMGEGGTSAVSMLRTKACLQAAFTTFRLWGVFAFLGYVYTFWGEGGICIFHWWNRTESRRNKGRRRWRRLLCIPPSGWLCPGWVGPFGAATAFPATVLISWCQRWPLKHLWWR